MYIYAGILIPRCFLSCKLRSSSCAIVNLPPYLFYQSDPLLLALAKLGLDLSHNGSSDLLRRRLATEISSDNTVAGDVLDAFHELRRGLLLAEPLEHLGGGPESSNGVGDTLASDIKGGAVDGLEHGGVLAAGVQVAGRGDTDGAGEGGSQVGENIGVLEPSLVP